MPRFDPVEFRSHDDQAAYYGGFYPTEEWARSLATVPRDQRANPHYLDRVRMADDEWVASLRERVDGYLLLEPEELLGLAPRRNRIAGNARLNNVAPKCPCGHNARLTWRPDDPDRIWCPEGHEVDPFELFPETGRIEITGPKGDAQVYPYHDASDGRRIYLLGEYMDNVRIHCLSEAADLLAMLYRATDDLAYARRSAAIAYDFACAVPHWPKIHRGLTSVASEEERFRPVDEQVSHAGIWRDRNHAGLKGIAGVVAYDLVVDAQVWDALDRLAEGRDARRVVEEDLFLYLTRDAVRADVHFPQPSYALRNHIPSQCEGMIAIGKAAGIPEIVHYAFWKLRQMEEKTIMADSTFPESMSYGAMHLYGMAEAASEGEGYSDPPGFCSTIDGNRFDNLDLPQQLPGLHRAIDVLKTMVYPDGNYIQAHDTTYWSGGGREPVPDTVKPILYPAFGHAVLGRGDRARGDQIQAHLHYSGNWGHDHEDMLNLMVWAYGEELVSDFGKIMTYRLFADGSWGHNLVVVDRQNQESVSRPGSIVGWHAPQNEVQVIEASDPAVYPQCEVYRRSLCLIPIGGADAATVGEIASDRGDHLVLDVFEVAGGSTHEWMAQGNCINAQTLEVSVPMAYHADSYADDGLPFTPPAHREWEKELQAQGLRPRDVSPWYGVFRDVHRGEMTNPLLASFTSDDRDLPDLRLHLIGPDDANVYTCTVPSLKQGRDARVSDEWDHSIVEKTRTPKLVVRRDGSDLRSRFVALWEPTRGRALVDRIEDLAPADPDLVALDIHLAGGEGVIRTLYSSEPDRRHRLADGTEFQGRYAVVRSFAGGRHLSLYDTSCYWDSELAVEIAERPALPLVGVGETEDGFFVYLEGEWEGLSQESPTVYREPEHVLLTDGDGHVRAFPVESIESVNGRTRLRCSRHPGFDYDAATKVLTERSFPFRAVDGPAQVRSPSRAWIQTGAKRPTARRVRTSSRLSVDGTNVEPTDEWVSASR